MMLELEETSKNIGLKVNLLEETKFMKRREDEENDKDVNLENKRA